MFNFEYYISVNFLKIFVQNHPNRMDSFIHFVKNNLIKKSGLKVMAESSSKMTQFKKKESRRSIVVEGGLEKLQI